MRAAVEALGRAGHSVDLLTLGYGENVPMPNARIHRASRLPFVRSVPIGPSLRKGVSDLMLLRLALRMARGGRFDVIHGVEEGAFIAWWLHRRTGIPFVYDMDSHLSQQLRDRGGVFRALGGVGRILEERALREAAGVLAVCPALLEVARRHHAGDTVALLPDAPLQNGEGVHPASDVQALEGTRIVYVGNLEPYQGVEILLDGFRRVAQRHSDARLIVVGGPESKARHYAELTSDLVARGRLSFLGPRPLGELGGILAAADIVVSPRVQGVNTPMKIYSYLESGRPVLATRLATHTQVLDDDVACLVSPTAEGIGDGLERLLADPVLRRDLGAAGRARVRKRYGARRFQERLGRFYATLAERLESSGEESHEVLRRLRVS